MSMPTYLEGFAYFQGSLVVQTGQKALLGEITPTAAGGPWADYLTKEQQKYLASKKK